MYERKSTSKYHDPRVEHVDLKCRVLDLKVPPHWEPWPHREYESLDLEFDGFERYFEEIYSDSSGPRSAWKNCDHYKVFTDATSPALGTFIRTDRWTGARYYTYPHLHEGISLDPYAGYKSTVAGSVGRPFGGEGKLNEGLPSFHVEQSDYGFVPPPENIETLKAYSLKSMLPNIKSELSLLNSLYELKDFKSLFAMIPKLRSLEYKLADVARNFYEALRKNADARKRLKRDQPIGKAIRFMSGDVYLQWKFNISPLISDVCGIFTALSKYEKRINDLITRSGRPQRMHYVYRWQEHPESRTDTSGSVWPGDIGSLAPYFLCHALVRDTRTEPAEFHAEMEYSFNYTSYQVEHARLLALLDYFGVNLNPAIIWNAIPWSFVVDWVFSVGKYLDQFKTQNMEPKINIRRYLWSIKRKRVITVFVNFEDSHHPELSVPTGRRRLPTVYESSYRRKVELPTMSSIQSSGLNSQEFTLGAALVLSRRRNSKRRTIKS